MRRQRTHHRLSACVHTMPPGFSARCMASKKGCRGNVGQASRGQDRRHARRRDVGQDSDQSGVHGSPTPVCKQCPPACRPLPAQDAHLLEQHLCGAHRV